MIAVWSILIISSRLHCFTIADNPAASSTQRLGQSLSLIDGLQAASGFVANAKQPLPTPEQIDQRPLPATAFAWSSKSTLPSVDRNCGLVAFAARKPLGRMSVLDGGRADFCRATSCRGT